MQAKEKNGSATFAYQLALERTISGEKASFNLSNYADDDVTVKPHNNNRKEQS